MNVGITGGLGVGKTILVAFLLKQYHETYGYNIFCNFKLKKLPFHYLNSIEDFEKMNKKEGNVIGLDELFVSADSRSSMAPLVIALSRRLLQIRKMSSVMKPTHMFFTSQLISSVEYRIRSSEICNSIWKPKILAKDDITGRPLMMSVDVYVPDKERIDEFKWRKKFYIPSAPKTKEGFLDLSLYDICDYYDTSEVIESIQSNTLRTYVDKYFDKLPEKVKKVGQIEAYLHVKEPGLSKSFVRDIAVLVDLVRKGEEVFDDEPEGE